jgi:hypothetical protein
MKVFKRRYFRWALFIIFLLFLLPNFIPFNFFLYERNANVIEQYDPNVANKIRSVDQLLEVLNTQANEQGIKKNSLAYFEILSSIVRKRFYHAYSHYSLKENWIAAVAGKFAWYDLSAIVIPHDIMQYPMAACSQQSIIMMECFKRLGIPFRKVGMTGHYACEGFIENSWYYFDTDKEPAIKGRRASFEYLASNKMLYDMYNNVLTREEVDRLVGTASYGTVNRQPAREAIIFHKITRAASRLLWIIPFVWWAFLYSNRKRKLAAATEIKMAIEKPEYSLAK